MKVSRNIEDYEVRNWCSNGRWYICSVKTSSYLHKSGVMHDYEQYWNTKQEAEDFLKEFCMENYCVIEGKKVKLSDETIKELKKALIPEETYKVGDVLLSKYNKVIVAELNKKEKRVGLVLLEGDCKGYRYSSESTIVHNTRNITKKELSKMTYYTTIWKKSCE